MKKYEDTYPREITFYSTLNLSSEDIEFFKNKESFFNGLKKDNLEILSVLNSINVRVKKIEDTWK
jgi:hypothetical protein